MHFPSAEAAKKGPYTAELVYEDPKRDLAFLAVKTDLPAIQVASSYTFRKGEDVTVIGNPGLGEDAVLENAISRGLMSTKTTLEGSSFYQLSISVNPGNSGGPVFDSHGQVIGVVTLKSSKQEALAFSIPVERSPRGDGEAGQAAFVRSRQGQLAAPDPGRFEPSELGLGNEDLDPLPHLRPDRRWRPTRTSRCARLVDPTSIGGRGRPS